MRIRAVLRLLPLSVLLQVSAGVVLGQQAPPSCDHESCALRLEGGVPLLFIPPTVIRGASATPLGRVNRSSSFETLFSGNESAAAYYNTFKTHDRRGDLAISLGVAILVGAAVASGDATRGKLTWLGGGFLVAAHIPYHRARKAFSKALRVYNQSLPAPSDRVR